MQCKENLFPQWWNKIASLWMIFVLFIVYTIVNSIISLAEGVALAHDDAKLNVLVQNFQWGYLPDNPPLYEWLLLVVQSITGPTIISFLVIKYGLLLITSIFTWLVIKKITQSRAYAALSAIALLSLYQIGWNYHQAFTHSLVLITAISFFVWALLNVIEKKNLLNYSIFGISVGLGLLSKYSFPATIIIMIMGAWLERENRTVFYSPKILLSIVIAFLMLAPHANWLLHHAGDFDNPLQARFGSEAPYISRVFQGIPSAMWAAISFFFPLLLFVGFVAPKILLSPFAQGHRWLVRLPFIGGAFLLAFVIILGAPSLPERYGIAFMLPGFFGLMPALWQTKPNSSRMKMLIYAVCGMSVLIPGVRVMSVIHAGPPFCKGCRQWVPFDGLAAELNPAVRLNADTLVGFDDQTAGNLKRFFPKTRVLSTHLPHYTPPQFLNSDKNPGKCFFVWSMDLSPSPPEEFLSSLAPPQKISIPWNHPLKRQNWRTTNWNVVEIPSNNYAYGLICGINFKKVDN